MTDSQKYRMRLVSAHLDYIWKRCPVTVYIPDVDRNSAITVISEIGTDMVIIPELFEPPFRRMPHRTGGSAAP